MENHGPVKMPIFKQIEQHCQTLICFVLFVTRKDLRAIAANTYTSIKLVCTYKFLKILSKNFPKSVEDLFQTSFCM